MHGNPQLLCRFSVELYVRVCCYGDLHAARETRAFATDLSQPDGPHALIDGEGSGRGERRSGRDVGLRQYCLARAEAHQCKGGRDIKLATCQRQFAQPLQYARGGKGDASTCPDTERPFACKKALSNHGRGAWVKFSTWSGPELLQVDLQRKSAGTISEMPDASNNSRTIRRNPASSNLP